MLARTGTVTVADIRVSVDREKIGRSMYSLISELYPICRSITGQGVRETLRRIQQEVPLTIHEVPTGTQVFDWTVPKEWNIRDAYIKDSRGAKVVDFAKSNLHVVGYSVPVRARLPLRELKKHLFSLEEHPDWIPYRTTYYKENWGFCLSHNQFLRLEDGEYEVCVDSSLENGHLTYGELLLKGESPEEVLLSCHICHPSLCNDNLSGISLTTALAAQLSRTRLRFSYRFLFVPGTIGSITWLSRNRDVVSNIRHGLVVTCVGDCGRFVYKRSRRGDGEIDKAVVHVLKESGVDHEILDFFPYGYDERQYCSPGFNLPVGSLSRSPHGRYPEYHTSADNLSFVKEECLAASLGEYLSVIYVLENNRKYVNQNPYCEPQLGRRGLYRATGGQSESPLNELALLWVLNLSDGSHDLLGIAARAGMTFETIKNAADALVGVGLLRCCEGQLGDGHRSGDH
jgi:aminopeptidase-like protein